MMKKQSILNRIYKSDIFTSVNGYASYSLSFFGKSSFTDITEIEDEKVLYLKKDKFPEVKENCKFQELETL